MHVTATKVFTFQQILFSAMPHHFFFFYLYHSIWVICIITLYFGSCDCMCMYIQVILYFSYVCTTTKKKESNYFNSCTSAILQVLLTKAWIPKLQWWLLWKKRSGRKYRWPLKIQHLMCGMHICVHVFLDLIHYGLLHIVPTNCFHYAEEW